jgi:hypothetical protein
MAEVRELEHDLRHGPVRDAFPVGEAPAPNDHGLETDEELRGQPRLADARRTEQREEHAGLLRGHPLPRVAEQAQLSFAAHQRRIETSRQLSRVHGHEPVGTHPFGLPLQLERLELLGGDRTPEQPHRLRPEQHFARRGRLLEARGDIDSIPGREALLRAGYDLACVDADS